VIHRARVEAVVDQDRRSVRGAASQDGQTTDVVERKAAEPEVVGANVTNVGISPYLSQVDLNTLAVKK